MVIDRGTRTQLDQWDGGITIANDVASVNLSDRKPDHRPRCSHGCRLPLLAGPERFNRFAMQHINDFHRSTGLGLLLPSGGQFSTVWDVRAKLA
jgi:hypothetical protein